MVSCDLKVASHKIPRPSLDNQLRRFHRSYRRRLRKIAHSSRSLKDLIYSFPGAAFAIAGGTSNSTQRAQAIELVHEGAGLRQIGDAIGLPVWARRLPPETFCEQIGEIPQSAEFAKHITNAIPKKADECGIWFRWVRWSHQLCDENFALWIARQRFWSEMEGEPDIVFPLAAYAWYSQNESSIARNLMESRWAKHTSFTKAIHGARRWQMRCLYEYCNGDGQNAKQWFARQSLSGLSIVPLRTPNELADEGQIMGHCVADYTEAVLAGNCLIYSIRRGNHHLATMEVRSRSVRDANPRIIQLRGPRNAPVDEGVQDIIDVWLSQQGKFPFVGSGQSPLHPINPQRWEKLWTPYLETLQISDRAIRPRHIISALDKLANYA